MKATMRNARIRSTFLGREDHGVFTFLLYLDYNGSGQGFGNRVGVKMEHIELVLDTLKVDSWEKLPRTLLRVIHNNDAVIAIGHIMEDLWLMPHADKAWSVGTLNCLPLEGVEIES